MDAANDTEPIDSAGDFESMTFASGDYNYAMSKGVPTLVLEGGEEAPAEEEAAAEETEEPAAEENEGGAAKKATEEASGGNTGLIIGGIVGVLGLVGGFVYYKKSSVAEGGEFEKYRI